MQEKLKKIKCYLLDMDGTIYLSGALIDGAREAVERMRKIARVIFLTNNTSVARADYVKKLCGMGIEVTENDIYTAGNATIYWLKRFYDGKKIFLLGTEKLRDEFVTAGINIVDSAPDMVVIGFDTSLTYKNLSTACQFIRDGCPYIATHPDFNCPTASGYIPDVGSFLALIEASCAAKPLCVCGKPNKPIADGIMQKVNLEPSEIAMVGDRLMTDMLFAKNNNFVSVLVLSGEATREAARLSQIDIDVTLDSIAYFDR